MVTIKKSNGIHLSLRTFSVLPPNSDIFRLTATNDVENLKELFSKRLGSPHACEQVTGNSLLTVSYRQHCGSFYSRNGLKI